MGSLSKQVVSVRGWLRGSRYKGVCLQGYVHVNVPKSLISLDGPKACCLRELFKENVGCFMSQLELDVCVICWAEIFIISDGLEACMC